MENVLITCAQCGSQYSVGSDLLENYRKMRCSVCNNMWEIENRRKPMPSLPKPVVEPVSMPSQENLPYVLPSQVPNRENVQEQGAAMQVQPLKPSMSGGKIAKRTFSWLMLVSIVGNIVFWALYFTDFAKHFEAFFAKHL